MKDLKSYLFGYLLSLLLTSVAFISVVDAWFDSWALAGFLLLLATIQLVVQLYLFLHLGKESRPRWSFYALIFMIVSLLLFVLGTLWIMKNLNYNMMPEKVDQYLLDEEGIEP